MRILRIATLLTVSLPMLALHAQAHEATASRAADLQLGGGVSYVNTDYGERKIGYSLYGTLDVRTHLGVEVAFHQMNGNESLYERTYEVGGRYVLHYGNGLNPFVRVMYGRGVMNFPNNIANLAFNIGAVGGGVDYNLRTHINVRADYEYQNWFGFPPHGLTPQVATVGVAYHF